MTDEELVARLHLPWPKDESVDEVTLPLWVLELTAEAADRIEAQAAEIERLRGDLKKARGALHQIAGKKDYADDPWDIARTTLAEIKGESHV